MAFMPLGTIFKIYGQEPGNFREFPCKIFPAANSNTPHMYRFGRIPALKTIKAVKKGDELFSHYKVSVHFES